MVKICPSCNSENGDNSKFCKNCGEKLEISSSQVSSSQDSPKSEPKNNKNLIIGAAVIICAIIVAGAFMALNSNNSGNSLGANDLDSESISSDYYPYEFEGYTFNIPNSYYYYNSDIDEENDISTIVFREDEVRNIIIMVTHGVDSSNEEKFKEAYGSMGLDPKTIADIDGYYNKTVEGNAVGEMFTFMSGGDIVNVGVVYIDDPIDIAQIISSIQQEDVVSSSSSSSSASMSYSEASSYLSGASSTVIQNTFDEADANGDGVLTGSEISKFKKLADLTERTADTSNSENVEAQDYGAGDGTTKTRYCTTHGRVAVGSDNRCPYCEAEGLDSRTVKGSTEYI